MSCDLDAVYARSERMVGRRIADEFILVPLAGRGADIDALYNLNRVGAFIWERLDGSTTGSELIQALVESFEVDADDATRDYRAFIAQLESIQAVSRAE